jgi:hypothetical protein
MVAFSDILLASLAVGGIVWLQKSKRKEIPKEKASDWLQVQEITEDGLVLTEDNRYLLIVEVLPLSFVLKSLEEQKMIWSAFRECINMISHPIRLRTESHPYELEEYFQELRARATETDDVALMDYVGEMRETFSQYVEENQIQDRKYYLFLELDESYLAEAAAETTNPLLNDLFKKASSKGSIDHDSIRQELKNSYQVAQSVFFNIGMMTRPLRRRNEVLAYFYSSANREMASVIPYEVMAERVAPKGSPVQSISKIQYGGQD